MNLLKIWQQILFVHLFVITHYPLNCLLHLYWPLPAAVIIINLSRFLYNTSITFPYFPQHSFSIFWYLLYSFSDVFHFQIQSQLHFVYFFIYLSLMNINWIDDLCICFELFRTSLMIKGRCWYWTFINIIIFLIITHCVVWRKGLIIVYFIKYQINLLTWLTSKLIGSHES